MSGDGSPLWLLDRSSGEITLLLLSLLVALGIWRAALPGSRPLVVEGLHRNLLLLAAAFAAAHVAAALLDPFARLGPLDALVPFASAYRPLWLGLGVLSAYLILAIAASSWPVRRFGRPWARWLHRTAYLAWPLAVLHALGTGSDARSELFLFLDIAAVAAVALTFLVVRVGEGWATAPRAWLAAALACLTVTAGLGLWAAGGPLQAGWARAAGTPPALLAGPSPAPAPAPGT